MILRADEKNGIIELDGVPIAGVLQSLSVNGEIVIDSNNSASDGEPLKTMRGYKDKTISMSLKLLPVPKKADDMIQKTEEALSEDELNELKTEIEKTPYQILEEIEQIFMNKEDKTPKVMTLFSPHILARRINEVVFTGLSSSEDNTTETITITLNFEEFISAKYQ